MAKGRMINRSIGTDAKFNALKEHPDQWLYMRMLPLMDDHGRLTGDLFELKYQAIPSSKLKLETIGKSLGRMVELGLIQWAEGLVIQFLGFYKNQKIGHKPADSLFPSIDEVTGKGQQSLVKVVKGRSNIIKSNISKIKSNKSKSIYNIKNRSNSSKYEDVPKNVEMVIEYLKELGKAEPEKYGHKIYDHYDARGWFSGKTKIKKWKSCVKTWNLEVATAPIRTLTEIAKEKNRGK